ncbi:DAK2 domain-containing protein, partial [Candidatus Bipolaricaulota bacterium]|nr:DAK2 domain-containing protein [Candidatus Bipolaricaulota bacterium]
MSAETVNGERLRSAFRVIAEKMKERSEELRVLDAACGDGDLGITVTKGFTAIEARLDSLEGDPPARLLATLGMTFNNAAASTFGVFFATGFMHASNCITDQRQFSAEDFCRMLESAAEGITTRGHAQVGDRTILDALVPASEAARAAFSAGKSFDAVLTAAAAAAKQGAIDSQEL